jgi:hypothetical protein
MELLDIGVLPNLTHMEIAAFSLGGSIEVVGAQPKLLALYLESELLRDSTLAAVAKASQLAALTLHSGHFSNHGISFLSPCGSLEYLHFAWNDLQREWSRALIAIGSLRTLQLSGIDLHAEDILTICQLGIRALRLSEYERLNVDAVDALCSCTSLSELEILWPMPKAQLSKLRKALPKCSIS